MLVAHKNIAGVHIGMEKAVAEYLRKEHLYAALCQQLHVGILLFQRLDIGYGNTVDALHHQHIDTTVVRIHFRDIQHRAIFEVTPQLDGISRFTQQVQFVEQRFFVVAYHFQRTQTTSIRQQARHPARQAVDKLHICLDDRQDVRANDLDDHFPAVLF